MSENWIIPCNIKLFDAISHFRKTKVAVWKNSFTIHSGDKAYIYIGAPYGEIRFLCEVIAEEVDDRTLKENAYAIPAKPSHNYFSKKVKYVVLRLVTEYPSGVLTLTKLKERGLGQVQIQARTDRKVQQFIDQVDEDLRSSVNAGGEISNGE